MTETQQETQQEAPPVPIPVLVPEPESRLDQLMAQIDPAKAATAAAQEREKEITDAIKAEAERLTPPGAPAVIIRSPHAALPWKFGPRESWTLDSKGLKKADPAMWVRWAKKTVSWRLDPVK